jgi:hypothetical protein
MNLKEGITYYYRQEFLKNGRITYNMGHDKFSIGGGIKPGKTVVVFINRRAHLTFLKNILSASMS